jgi:nucleoid-associated protein YgaU
MTAGDDERGCHRGAGRSVLLAGWVLLLVLAVGMLHTLGRGPLAAPPVTRPGALPGWLDQRSAATLAFCTLRLAAMGSAGYLLATTLAGLMARIVGWARCSAMVDAISPLVVRRLVQGAAGLTVAATVSTTQAPAWAAPGVPAGPTSPTPIMRRLPTTAPPTTAPPTTAPPAIAPAPLLTAPPAQAAPATWVIRPGDNLWSVAEATLVRAWGRVPSDAEVDDYWTGLIAINRGRLAHSDDPDLVFPGQVFELPAPPPAGQP